MSDSCSGHCCKDFILPYTYEEMQERYQATVALGQTSGDYFEVPPLLIPLPGPTAGWHHQDISPEKYHHFTCKAHDAATGRCTIYATRPKMCRNYPYGTPCRYVACEWTGHRNRSPKLRVITE